MKFLLATLAFFCASLLSAQNQAIETEIRRLEQAEVEAVLAKDTETLKKLWDKDYVVHNPEGQIVPATPDPAARPVMQRTRTAFTRHVEHLTIRENLVISMGSETVVPLGEAPSSTVPVKRRYTNIWMKTEAGWKLIARHANVIP
ncbi:MAG TPA: nuclear transport factor 2 family protein [Opitutaceae bacterium]|nr:nuclear transport factor 2 family protein [Opitutaceae bacterium]